VFFITKKWSNQMSAPLPVEPTEPQPKPVEPQVTLPVTPPTTPAEPPIEQWDPERAKATILAQRAEEKKLKDQLKDYERLKAEETERVEAQMSKAEKATKRAEKLEADNAKLTMDILRRDVVAETGLPAVFADRLKGETKEAMLEDAKELLKVLPAEKTKPPHLNNTAPNNATTTETEAQKRERLLGNQSVNIFDPAFVQERGGGVRITTKEE